MRDPSVPDPHALERVWFVWVTQFGQDVDHAVTDEEMVTRSAGGGRYGAVFLPAAMEQPPGEACPPCGAVLVDRLPATPQIRHRRPA